jgi:hypothetical protein
LNTWHLCINHTSSLAFYQPRFVIENKFDLTRHMIFSLFLNSLFWLSTKLMHYALCVKYCIN